MFLLSLNGHWGHRGIGLVGNCLREKDGDGLPNLLEH